jgi:hypothetical protein
MKSYTSESSTDKKELKKFISRHTAAYVDWEILQRLHNDSIDEIPLDNFLDMIGRDYVWYNTFLNNIKVRMKK